MPADPPRRGPVILDLATTALPDMPGPAQAPPVPDPGAAAPAELALRAAAMGPSPRARLFWAGALGLVSLWLGLGVEAWVTDLFARSPLLGWVGAACLGLVGLALATLVLAELAALGRLARIEGLRDAARMAVTAREVQGVLDGLARLYGDRPGQAGVAERLAVARADTPDAPAMLALAERAWMAAPDAQAEAAVARAARDVAAATALIPLAVVDVLAVLAVNLRMIRAVAQAYGGRAGWIGSWRLLRAVARHLVATGLIAATDDLVGPLVGGGVLGRLSRRFGEAAVNAALTARVGVAAIEVCRPLPFAARPQPRATGIVTGALRGWWSPEPPPPG